jgi:cytochrome c oxidase subunit III
LSESASITPAGALTGRETFVTTPGHGTGADTHGHGPTHVQHQFDDAAQQKDAVTLGMWAFLATEIMFFGGAFLLYSVYRNTYPEAFAQASRLENWKVGFFNTLVLLGSSYTVVLAVHAAHHGNNRKVVKWIAATILCAFTFFGVKVFEYSHLYHEHLMPSVHFDTHKEHFKVAPTNPSDPDSVAVAEANSARLRQGGRIFFSFYFVATGLHALHMVIGVGVFLWVIAKARQGTFSPDYYNPVEISGLYWHFVDIVWIFLYPMLYLIDLSSHTGH